MTAALPGTLAFPGAARRPAECVNLPVDATLEPPKHTWIGRTEKYSVFSSALKDIGKKKV
jgi:hypothetical protein